MRQSPAILLILLSLFACTNKPSRDKNILIDVNGDQLTYRELENAIPKEISKRDSTEFADKYIDTWITHRLLLQKAELNINKNEKIDQLVEAYKEQLLIENYLALLVEKKADIQPTEEQISAFYEKHKTQYLLSENILQGILVILPLDASNQKTLMQLLSEEETDRAMIEAYCIQNAAKVDFFQSNWMTMHAIKKHLPELKEDEKRMLSRNKLYETEDSLFNYILKIDSFKLIDDIAPLGYVSKQIKEFLLNNNKIAYLRRMEKDLYDDAKRKGFIYDNR